MLRCGEWSEGPRAAIPLFSRTPEIGADFSECCQAPAEGRGYPGLISGRWWLSLGWQGSDKSGEGWDRGSG